MNLPSYGIFFSRAMSSSRSQVSLFCSECTLAYCTLCWSHVPHHRVTDVTQFLLHPPQKTTPPVVPCIVLPFPKTVITHKDPRDAVDPEGSVGKNSFSRMNSSLSMDDSIGAQELRAEVGDYLVQQAQLRGGGSLTSSENMQTRLLAGSHSATLLDGPGGVGLTVGGSLNLHHSVDDLSSFANVDINNPQPSQPQPYFSRSLSSDGVDRSTSSPLLSPSSGAGAAANIIMAGIGSTGGGFVDDKGSLIPLLDTPKCSARSVSTFMLTPRCPPMARGLSQGLNFADKWAQLDLNVVSYGTKAEMDSRTPAQRARLRDEEIKRIGSVATAQGEKIRLARLRNDIGVEEANKLEIGRRRRKMKRAAAGNLPAIFALSSGGSALVSRHLQRKDSAAMTGIIKEVVWEEDWPSTISPALGSALTTMHKGLAVHTVK